nr:receptor-like serine/threonine-protein kinase SD1-8 [Ipomoea trifida]
MTTSTPLLLWIFLSLLTFSSPAASTCSYGCDLALASYYAWPGMLLNLTFLSQLFSTSPQKILDYNPTLSIIPDSILVGSRINIPFRCDCLENGQFLGHAFPYSVAPGDTYDTIAKVYFSNLTTVDWLKMKTNWDIGTTLNVTVNCSCANRPDVSNKYDLFITYPLTPGESLITLAGANNVRLDLLQSYNPGVRIGDESGLVFIPGIDPSSMPSSLPPGESSKKWKWWIWLAVILSSVIFLLIVCSIFYFKWKKNAKGEAKSKASLLLDELRGVVTLSRVKKSNIDKKISHELQVFSFKSIAMATNNFSNASMLGKGGFGPVYKGTLPDGQEVAIKRLAKSSGQGLLEFKNEILLIARLQHTNLAWELWREGRGVELMDPTLSGSCPEAEIMRCIQVGLLCVQDDAKYRPSMSTVVSMFANESAELPLPKQPAFFIAEEVGKPRKE